MDAHTWRERTEDGIMFYSATHHAGKWSLARMRKVGRSEESEWEPLEFNREYWLKVRDILWRKYQRKRGAWRLIEEIDKLLEDEFPEEVSTEDEDD